MDFFVRFLFDFMSQFFGGLIRIFTNLGLGIKEMLDLKAYANIIKGYSSEISGTGWILVALVIIVFVALIAFSIFLIYLIFKKYFRIRKSLVEQETLLEEVADLNKAVLKLTQEKDKILAMKVSQLGLKPGEVSENIEKEVSESPKPSDVSYENKKTEEKPSSKKPEKAK